MNLDPALEAALRGEPPPPIERALVPANGARHDEGPPLDDGFEHAHMQDDRSALETKAYCGLDLARPLPEIDYISKSLAMPGGSGAPHMFGGFGFSGKTVAAQSQLLALSAGRSIWKSFGGPGEPIPVTHVDNEQGIALTQRRYQRLATAMGVELDNLEEMLRVLVFPKLRNGRRVLLTPEFRHAWKEIMTGRRLLLLDSLATSREQSVSENANEVRAGIDLLGELSEETNCRGLIIHHANKSNEDDERDPRFILRGAGGIFDACDAVYLLSGARGEATKVQQTKARSHGEPIDDFAIVISDVETEGDKKWGLAVHVAGIELIAEQRDARDEKRLAAQLSRDCSRIRAVLARGVRLSQTDLQAASRLNAMHFKPAIASMKGSGEVAVDFVKNGKAVSHMHFLVTK